jgi:hypothetical protein
MPASLLSASNSSQSSGVGALKAPLTVIWLWMMTLLMPLPSFGATTGPVPVCHLDVDRSDGALFDRHS